MLSKATLLSLALPVAYAAVHESLDSLPRGWSATAHTATEDTAMTLQVALQYRNIASLESRLQALSDPTSKTYGQWLDTEAMNAIFAPTTETESKVKTWLAKSGAKDIISDGSLISFSTTVGQANKMLASDFRYYTDGKSTKLRTTQYSVPDELTHAVELITPTTYFGGEKSNYLTAAAVSEQHASSGKPSKSCEIKATIPLQSGPLEFNLFTPECARELYNVGNYTGEASSGSTIAFGSFLNQSASYSDLAVFEKKLGLPSHNFTVLKLINGGVDDQNPKTEQDGEANLDVQNIAGLVGEIPIGEYITGGLPPFHPDLLTPNKSTEENEPYLPYYQYLLSQPNSNLPYVISNSYGDHEDTVPFKYATRVCNMIGMMGMRGRTILESSADEGTGAVCRSNHGAKKPQFTPQFPPTCPYVTAVGGTQFFSPEAAWNASSGGFSNYFAPAWYQKEAINTYLTKYISASTKKYYASNGYVNFTGRGFPDVSAHSLYPFWYNIIDGQVTPNGGTSAASPAFAAILSLVNEVRFKAGKPSLGFVNPLLYQIAPKGLHDITRGGSVGCTGTDLQNGEVIPGAGIIPYASWNATVGWDPVTGLGTPDFEALQSLAVQSYN